MSKKYFPILRIKEAIEHLQKFNSNWVLVPLVLAVNGVKTSEEVNTSQRAGTDEFLSKHFSGSLIGLPPFSGGSALRPRFTDVYRTLKQAGKDNDYVAHQGTKLWANGYSSRGYREMKNKGLVIGEKRSTFQLSNTFKNTFETELPATFHFEELLVWLYAFEGFPDSISNWESLSIYFQEQYLGSGERFQDDYKIRFHVNNSVSWPTELLSTRPTDEEFQRALLPSMFLASELPSIQELNKILYGPPGVGKSFAIKQEVATCQHFITTFHPEYSYADFVGAFRPATENYGTPNQLITYRFRPEVFLTAYVEAWQKRTELVYLIIEEINRGNSAAIFGDTFQLLDRDAEGYSEYAISCREEIRHYLKTAFTDEKYAENMRGIYSLKFNKELDDPYSVMLLPNNFIIRATMNTSDQSLFPMDSAFKRRWAWQYTPIQYGLEDRTLIVKEKKFSWNDFLYKVNSLIYQILETEDKCIGPFFVKNDIISADEFRNKVIFYLWNDVLRDELPEMKLKVFPKRVTDEGESDLPINFNDFFDEKNGWDYVLKALEQLKVNTVAS